MISRGERNAANDALRSGKKPVITYNGLEYIVKYVGIDGTLRIYPANAEKATYANEHALNPSQDIWQSVKEQLGV
jgi:hypothetical protein